MNNMRDLKDLNIKMLKESFPMSSQVGLGEDFCIFDVRYDTDMEKNFSRPLRLEGNIILFCVRGSIRMSINLDDFDIVEGSLVIVTAQDIVKVERIYSQSPDQLHFVMIAMSENFVSELKVDFRKILNEGLILIETPVINLDNDLQEIFTDYLKLLARITDSGLRMNQDAVRSLVSSMSSIAAGQWLASVDKIKSRSLVSTNLRSDHKRLVFQQFMKLIHENYSKEHQVIYYADRLCISPKYLSRLCKEISGKSAPEWIDAYIMLDAKNLLKYSTMPIKEIVYRLSFSNQTVFYKFFKKHTGMTPTEYRNS